MRLLLASVVAAVLAAGSAPVLAGTAVDTTGTTYATDRVVVPMTFPIVGATSFSDTYLTCRSGCARKHMGQDLMGAKMSPVLATFNGTISSLRREASPGSGNYLVLTGDNGWSTVYLHVNNDNPGTDDGRGTANWAFPKGIETGVRVMAGQLIAWRGDSGNAESTGAHIHFELRKGSGWGGVVYNAYPSLVAARRLAAPLPSGPHPDGSLLRSPTGVLFVTAGAFKRVVTPSVLAANGLSAANAVNATAAESLLYKTGPPLGVRDGALVRDPSGAVWRVLGRTRYAVTPGAGQRVVPVATADVAGLTVLDAPATPTSGMLVRTEGKIYAVDAFGVLHQVNSYVMASWGWSAADVVDLPAPVDPPVDPSLDPSPDPSLDPELPPAGPEFGDPLGFRDGTLANVGGRGPAVLSGGVVRRLWDTREIAAYGYAGKPRLNVPGSLVTGLPNGEIAGPADRYR